MWLRFISLIVAYWWKNYVLSFQNISLTLRNTLERTPEAISNQNLFLGFYHNAKLLYKKWTQKIKLFRRTFVKKNLAIVLTLEILGLRVFHYSQVRLVLFPSGKKWPNIHPLDTPSLILNVYFLPMKDLLSLLLLEIEQ